MELTSPKLSSYLRPTQGKRRNEEEKDPASHVTSLKTSEKGKYKKNNNNKIHVVVTSGEEAGNWLLAELFCDHRTIDKRQRMDWCTTAMPP